MTEKFEIVSFKDFTSFTTEDYRQHLEARYSNPIDRLPYGYWTYEDGSEVLFDRGYVGLWKRDGGGLPAYKHSQRGEVVGEFWFWYDWEHPRTNKTTREKVENVLKDWGVSDD